MVIDLPDAIAGRDVEASDAARAQFISKQLDNLAALAASLKSTDRSTFNQLSEALADAAPQDIERVVTAPIVTQRLRTTARLDEPKLIADVISYLVTEGSARGDMPVQDVQWTALGDTVVVPGQPAKTAVTVRGLSAVDAASPQARSMNALTALCEAQLRPPLDEGQLGSIQATLTDAMTRLKKISPALYGLVSTCTLSLVVSEDPALNFSSSTHGLYIGRVALAARDWTKVSVAGVLDAMVHESIHCMLLMLDTKRPLLKDDLMADRLPPVASPWTGTPLPVPTYVHAVMVWFGLVHLWSRASTTTQFPGELSEEMLSRASRGFEAGDVVARMGSEALGLLSKHTITSLEAMQRQVREMLH